MSNETLHRNGPVASGAAVQHKPLTAAQRQRRAEWAALVASLALRKQGGQNHPINVGPLNVKRATGVMASV